LFNKYDFIKQDLNAKSLAFNILKDISCIDNALLNELKVIGTSQKTTIRLSLHSSPSEDLHNMIIFLLKNSNFNIHKHLKKTETYHIMEGSMFIIFFDEFGNITSKIKLSKNDNLLCRVPRNQYHTTIVTSDYSIFHESRKGPFNIKGDSIVPSWASNIKLENLEIG